MKEAGHAREPRVSVSRSIFALVNDMDRAYFGSGGKEQDQIGFIEANTRAIFGRGLCGGAGCAGEGACAGTRPSPRPTRCFLSVPNQLGVAYNEHVIEMILKHVAPALGWR